VLVAIMASCAPPASAPVVHVATQAPRKKLPPQKELPPQSTSRFSGGRTLGVTFVCD
jgi:hypothetical protein